MALDTQPRACHGVSYDQVVAVAANTLCIITPAPKQEGSQETLHPDPEAIHTQWAWQRPHLVESQECLVSTAELPGSASMLPGSASKHWLTWPGGTSVHCLPADGDSTPQPRLRKLAGHRGLGENYAPG